MLEKIYYGNTLEDWGISLLIIVSAFIINKLIALFNRRVIKKITQKTKYRLDNILFTTLEAPVLLGIMLVAIWIAAQRLQLPITVTQNISTAYHVLIILNITWFCSRFTNALIEEYVIPKLNPIGSKKQEKRLDKTVAPLIKRFVQIVIWLIGIVTALNSIGVGIGAILGTLGVGGVAIALAMQDTVKNIIAGVTIYIDKPFRLGDRIKFDTFDGTVEDVGLRSTRIRTLENRLITIPNYRIMDTAIENVTTEPTRKIVTILGLTYDTTPEKMNKALAILQTVPSEVKNVSKKEVVSAFTEFASSSLNITFIYYIEKHADVLGTNSDVNMYVLQKFNDASLNFAFPSQTVYIAK
ncbi:transporter [Bacteroidia bacterium]|nr:transporter [Bacteroidia bacterium]